MDWKLDTVYVREGYDKAIVDAATKEIIAVVSNLDVKFVQHIINEHNNAISLARREGVEMAKDIYKSKQ